VISDTDKTRFSNLKNDEEKYEMISNMITTGEGNNHPNQLFSKRYVHGDPRSLIQILEHHYRYGPLNSTVA
jgi:hypothetical protein